MNSFLNSNNAASTTIGAIDTVATQVTLAPGTGTRFPSLNNGDYFVGTLSDALTHQINEIVKVTAIIGDVITIIRAQEGSSALAWPSGSIFENLWTSGQAQALAQMSRANSWGAAQYFSGISEVSIIDLIISGVLSIDPNLATVRNITINAAFTLAIINAASDRCYPVTLFLTATGVPFDINWGSILWGNNTPPTLVFIEGAVNVISFLVNRGTIYGFTNGLNFQPS